MVEDQAMGSDWEEASVWAWRSSYVEAEEVPGRAVEEDDGGGGSFFDMAQWRGGAKKKKRAQEIDVLENGAYLKER